MEDARVRNHEMSLFCHGHISQYPPHCLCRSNRLRGENMSGGGLSPSCRTLSSLARPSEESTVGFNCRLPLIIEQFHVDIFRSFAASAIRIERRTTELLARL